MATKPFWEESYRRVGRMDTFGGGKPSQEVVDIVAKLPKGARTLDLGCGDQAVAGIQPNCVLRAEVELLEIRRGQRGEGSDYKVASTCFRA